MPNRPFEDTLAETKENVQRAKAQLLKIFEFVPDDKLAWSPSPTARTPLWMLGHCASANTAFASLIRGVPFADFGLPSEPEALAAAIRVQGQETRTRAEAVRLIETSTDAVLQALDTVTEARSASPVETGFGTMPLAFWMTVPAMHMTAHACQLDYLQTIWGDLQNHRA